MCLQLKSVVRVSVLQRSCDGGLFGRFDFVLDTHNNTTAKGFNQMQPPTRTIVVALDMSKAFDTVNIHTLIG